MDSEELDQKSKIYFFFRMKFWNHIMNVAKDGLSRFKGDASFHLYHALSLILVNRLEEGIHELENISQENDVKLSASVALINAHKLAGVDNRELINRLELKVKDCRKSCEPSDYYLSAFVSMCFKKLDSALDYAEKSVNIQSSSAEFLSLKGWILLETGIAKPSDIKELFQNALQINQRYLDALFGYTECCMYQNQISEAINDVNKAIVYFNSTNLPLIQKFRIQLAGLAWDQALETLHRIVGVDPNNLYIRKMVVVISLCKRFNYDEIVPHVKQFAKTLESTESGNLDLMIECTELFTKIPDKHPDLALENTKILLKALQKNPENINLIIELGYQALDRNNLSDAARYFKTAIGIEENSFKALLGLSLWEYAENGKSQKLKEQIQFLTESKDSSDSTRLQLLIVRVCDNPMEKLTQLSMICERKLSILKHYPFSDTSLMKLDPILMLDVVQEYINEIAAMKQTRSRIHDSVHNMVTLILKWCPESRTAIYVLAKLLYLKGDETNALRTLENIFSKDSDSMIEGQLLMAYIQVTHGMVERASLTLEACVSSNFEVRENPLFHYITGLMCKKSGNFADAIKSLSSALNLMNSKSPAATYDKLGLIDKGNVYVEIIDTLHIVGQTADAERVLEEATEDLKDTPDEATILLLSAEYAMKRNNITDALDLISRVNHNNPCYTKAKTMQADILLKYRRDRYAYIAIYQDIIKEKSDSDSYVLLGDAYMNILEPDSALDCYEKALEQNPEDPNLMAKMGKALVDTHYFSRAVKYYEETVKKSNDTNLKLNLAELYMNLKQYERGELILLNEIEDEQRLQSDDVQANLRILTKLYMLLAQIQEQTGNITFALKSLKDAMETQTRLQKRIAIDQSVVPDHEIKVSVDIAMKMGELAILLKSNEQAINFYKEGLSVSPDNITILVAIGKLYMQMNNLDMCQKTCKKILEIQPENESASVMMADIAFRKVDFDMALYHFTQLVTKQVTNFEALIRLIQILRRTGNIEGAVEFLDNYESFVGNPMKDTRFLYCKALYDMYSGNPNSALRNFNSARNDPDLGISAVKNMIEICLNPDDEMLAEQFIDTDDIEYKDSRSMALQTADRLLREFKIKLGSSGDDMLSCRVLTNFCLLASKDKYSVERALEDFVMIAHDLGSKDNISIILGMATAYTLLKQTQRAKNQLKRVNKAAWNFEDAEYLERCWLLLADYYIQSNKYEIARELINKVITYNKSCNKAYEYLGQIDEKEQHYKEAVRHYDQAWKYGGKSNPSVGYKLAYSLMKCKRYPEAINIAQAVLKMNPEYPRLKKDILDKCMNNLRI